MKIFEVTAAGINEAAPGSFLAKAGVFAQAFGRGLEQQIFGGNRSTASKPGVTPFDRQSTAAALSDPMIKQLAAQTLASYTQEMLALQAKEPMPGTGSAYGVSKPSLVPAPKRQASITRLVSGVLSALTRDKVKNMNQLSDMINDIGKTDPATQVRSAQEKNKVMELIGLLVTNPDKTATARTFQLLVSSLYYLASQVTFKGGAQDEKAKVTVDPNSKQFFINGQPVNYSNPQHIAILNSQGITNK
jgi:hypothetical protein